MLNGKSISKSRLKNRTLNVAMGISLFFHLILFILIGLWCPVTMRISPQFKIYFVEKECSLTRLDDVQQEKKALTTEAETPTAGPSQSRPIDEVAATTLSEAPPPLPSSPLFEVSASSVAPIPSPIIRESGEAALASNGIAESSKENPGGGGACETVGSPKATAMDVEGCKLFILPPQNHPITLKEALPLCEGLSKDEITRVKTIEFMVNFLDDGQPSLIKLSHSCGNKEIDRAAQDLMQFMRFETGALKVAPEYYLTMVIVGN